MNMVVVEGQGKISSFLFIFLFSDILYRSWMYGGMAIRMAMELGLHENIENDNANPTLERLTEQETSRKVFWSIYTIDK
jgi:hypothetical protein